LKASLQTTNCDFNFRGCRSDERIVYVKPRKSTWRAYGSLQLKMLLTSDDSSL
jgi:hypothetical protein